MLGLLMVNINEQGFSHTKIVGNATKNFVLQLYFRL